MFFTRKHKRGAAEAYEEREYSERLAKEAQELVTLLKRLRDENHYSEMIVKTIRGER